MTNDDSAKEQDGYEVLTVKFQYNVLTEEQANELITEVHKTYRSLISKWCGMDLPDDLGTIEIKRKYEN